MRVLFTFPTPRPGSNPYAEQLARSLPPEVEWRYWSWKNAILWRYDVVHLHWAEYLGRHPRRSVAFAKKIALLVVVMIWRLRSVAVVQTIHNERPHEAGSTLERKISSIVDSGVNAWVRLNPATPERLPWTAYVPLGHYMSWFTAQGPHKSIPGRLLFFGLVRPYKGVEALMEGFTETATGDHPALTLHIVGSPHDDATRARVAALADRDPRIAVDLRHLRDDDLQTEIIEAELVVLPYRAMFNSSAALAALSLNRPIAVTNSESMSLLREEVGHHWVYLFDGATDGPALMDALAWVDETATKRAATPPDLSRRDWHDAGNAHADVYRRARELHAEHLTYGRHDHPPHD